MGWLAGCLVLALWRDWVRLLTFPTAASPSRTSLTLLLGLGAEALESVMEGEEGRFARSERPTLCDDSLAVAEWSGGDCCVDIVLR